MVNWIANWFIARTFPPLLEASGPALAYGLYATAAAISFFLVLFFVRETSGKEWRTWPELPAQPSATA